MPSSRRGGGGGEDIPELVPDFTDDIALAWRVLCRAGEDWNHDELQDEMVRAGVESRVMALRLYQIIPIAWGRFFLFAAGVYLPDECLVRDRRTGKPVRDRFSECELYQQIREFLLPRVGEVADRERGRVLGRSPEYNAFRQRIRTGARPGDLMLAPPILA